MMKFFAIILFCFFAGSAFANGSCITSHYGVGDGLHGSRTASGARFNAYGMTAAHRTIPLGTWVTVTAVATGRHVRVLINDRGPAKWTGKCLDLSYAAARAIGLLGNGRVTIR